MKIPKFDHFKRNNILEKYTQSLELLSHLHTELDVLYETEEASSEMKKTKRAEIKDLINSKKSLLEQYGALIPSIKISECPYTGRPLISAFDPVALDGFWWAKEFDITYKNELYPDTFRILRGGLKLHNKLPVAGSNKILAGPEVPYVIPRILEIPTMQMVISQIFLESGYTVYFLTYFSSTEPEPGQLTSSWLYEDQYYYRDLDGKKKWKIANDYWDFDIASWIEKGKIRWIYPDSDTLAPASSDPEKCPYVGISGVQSPRVIKNQQVFTRPLPDPSVDIDIFD